MTPEAPKEAGGPPLPGRTIVTARALQHLALGLVRDAARIPASDVSVSLSDDAGRLKATVTLPVSLGPAVGQSLIERGITLRGAVVQGMAALAAREVSSVDIRFSGVNVVQERRVA